MFPFFLSFLSASPPCSADYSFDPLPPDHSLLSSVLVFKHGLRAPLDKIPGHDIEWNCSSDTWLYPGGNSLTDSQSFHREFKIRPLPDRSFLRGSCRAGELLPGGAAQLKVFADYVLKHYGDILPKMYGKRKIGWRSTYTNRCLGSLQMVAEVLFPGNEPIDVFVANEELESLVPNGYLCPAFEDVMIETLNENGSFGMKLARFQEKLEEIKKEWKLLAMPHWMRLAELLVTRDCTEVGFTPGTDRKLMEESMEVVLDFYREIGRTENGRRLASGLLLSEIYLTLRDYLVGGSDATITFVCGHTLSMISLMTALNVSLSWPPFGAFVGFDLLENTATKEYLVRVSVNGKVEAKFTWKDFEKNAIAMRPGEEECRIQYPYPERNKKSLAIKLLQMSFS
jgi:hypothetical protein